MEKCSNIKTGLNLLQITNKPTCLIGVSCTIITNMDFLHLMPDDFFQKNTKIWENVHFAFPKAPKFSASKIGYEL